MTGRFSLPPVLYFLAVQQPTLGLFLFAPSQIAATKATPIEQAAYLKHIVRPDTTRDSAKSKGTCM